jgi:hypothetical protein
MWRVGERVLIALARLEEGLPQRSAAERAALGELGGVLDQLQRGGWVRAAAVAEVRAGRAGAAVAQLSGILGQLQMDYWLPPIIQAADRAARQLGPDALIDPPIPHEETASPEAPSPAAGEARPKGTAEVRPQGLDPDPDSPYHGGDGASGEVASSPPRQGGDAQRTPDDVAARRGDDGAGSGPESGTSSDPGADAPVPRRPGAAAQAHHRDGAQQEEEAARTPAGEEPAAEQAGCPASGTGQLADPVADSPAAPSASEPEGLAGESTARTNPATAGDAWPDGQAEERGGADGEEASATKACYRSLRSTPSSQARSQWGGAYAALAGGVDLTLVTKARRALARLIEGGEREDGPRHDWQRFCERLLSHRPPAVARREEEGRPAILVLPDVSGSCSAFAERSLAVARAVAALGVTGAEVLVVSHSNGYPHEVLLRRGRVESCATEDSPEATWGWYQRLLRQHHVEAVVALGDWDAAWLYRLLALHPQVRRLVWLDVWSSRRLPPTLRQARLRQLAAQQSEPWPPRALQRVRYVVGCGEQEDFVAGLELALKAGR